jgi:nitrogenase-stabilizing/protective protein
MTCFRDDLDDLETAEQFLDYFKIAYDQRVVNVNRLHILQRFHDYMSRETGLDDLPDDDLRQRHVQLIQRAYDDFATSDAIKEKVFKVHQEQAERQAASFVSLDSLLGRAVG